MRILFFVFIFITSSVFGSHHVFVTGGAGYIGSQVCKALDKQGLIPVVFDNLSTGSEQNVKWGPLIKGDILDQPALVAAMGEYQPIAVIHLAASIIVSESVEDPSKYYQNNSYGTFCLLEAMRQCKIKHLIFSSTSAVYGEPASLPISEEHCPQPLCPYASSKYFSEKMIEDFAQAYDLSFTIFRYFNVAGADLDLEIGKRYISSHLLSNLIGAAMSKVDYFEIFGTDYPTKDGTAIRDYIHVMDIADAHVLALNHLLEGKENLTLNLGTGSGYSVREMFAAVQEVLEITIPVHEGTRRPGDSPILFADSQKALSMLGWKPRYSDLQTLILSEWEWHQKLNDEH